MEEEEEFHVGLQVRRSCHGHAITADSKRSGLVTDEDEDEGFSSSIESVIEEHQGTESGGVENFVTDKIDESFSSHDLLKALKMPYEEENTNDEYLTDDDDDVEGVLEKQKTYDLICPDCHSCITKRVILVRRKRIKYRRPKVEKPPEEETIPQGRLDDIETDVFRCLSCFTFFIPSGNAQNRYVPNINSFFSFFASNATTTAVEQGTVKPSNSSQSPEIFLSGRVPDVPLSHTTLDITAKPEEAIKGHNDGSDDLIQSTQEALLDEFEAEVEKVTSDHTEMKHETLPEKDGGGSTVNYYISPSVQVIYNVGVVNNSAKEDKKAEEEERLPESVVDAVHQYNTESNGSERESEAAGPEGGATEAETRIQMGEAAVSEVEDWDILKSTVYGGLIESITSLAIVSSAAGAGAKTSSILGLALANLAGGLFVMAHHLREMRNDTRYTELFGRRDKFKLHALTVILSFLIFGATPPIIYGFSFRESDDRELKLAVVAASSLVCITLLATGKAHFQNQPKSYLKTVMYYVGIGFMTSGVSYVVGDLFDKLMKNAGLFKLSSVTELKHHGWASN